MKNLLKYFLVLIICIALFAILLVMSYLSGKATLNMQLTDVGPTSAKVISLGKADAPFGKSLFLNGQELITCTEATTTPCISDEKSTDAYKYFEISNLQSESIYSLEWHNVLLYQFEKLFSNDISNFVTPILPQTSTLPTRIYGQVVDESGNGISDALVLIKPTDTGAKFPTISTVANASGYYSLDYIAQTTEGVAQDVVAYAPNGKQTTYKTVSTYNQPIADVQIDGGAATSNLAQSSLVNKAYAAGVAACFTNGMGGMRVQCAENVDWMSEINPNNCPDPTKVRLGLIQHTSDTHFYPSGNPSSVTMQLVESGTTTPVATVKNGEYIATSRLVLGKKYIVQAVINGAQCSNPDGSVTSITLQAKTTAYPTKNIDPATKSVNMCQKIGENYASFPDSVSIDKMQKGIDNGLSFGEVLITNVDEINTKFKGYVVNAKNTGITPVLRICYQGNCNIKNGKAYGDAIVSLYNGLRASGQLPQNGIYIHVGHNEPNVAEYQAPATEAAFAADTINKIENAGLASQNPNDSGIKMLGPNLDLFHKYGAGESAGVKNMYTAGDYLKAMLDQNGAFKNVAGYVYAWAVNDYMWDPDGVAGKDGVVNVGDDIEAFSKVLQNKGLNDKIFITEIGRNARNSTWDDFAALLKKLDGRGDVVGILLFDSLQVNGDPNYSYAKNLLAKVDIKGLCSKKSYTVPQEGSSTVQVESKYIDGNPSSTAPTHVNDGNVPVKASAATSEALLKAPSNVLGATSVSLPATGEYQLKSTKYTFGVTSVAKLPGDPSELKFFVDTNGNGIMDAGEQYLADTSDITAQKVGDVSQLTLEKGVNMVSVPIYSKEMQTAQQVSDEIASQSGYVTSVGMLNNSVSSSNQWKIMNIRGGTAYSSDFSIVPGKGVLVVSQKDSSVIVRGSLYSKPVSVFMREGWNLVSLQGANMAYYKDARALLQAINASGTITATNVTMWDPSRQLYQMYSMQSGTTVQEFGYNFPLDNKQAIFVFVTKGSNYWTPQ